MNIQVLVMCDAATEENGKLNILGAFEAIYASHVPAVHSQFTVALRLTFSAGDEGSRKLKLVVLNADGRPIMKFIEIPVEVSFPDDVHVVTQNYVVNIRDLEFVDAGLHSVDLRLDDRSHGTIPFSVKLVPHPGRVTEVSTPNTEG